MRSIPVLLSLLSCLLGQDAGMVLRTSVGYRTQKASRSLTDDQKKEADRLEALAVEANRSQKYGEALRHLYHGIAVMGGTEWTAETEAAAALQPKAEHAIVAPGSAVTLSLTALYDTHLAEPLKATVVLRPVRGEGEAVLVENRKLDPLPARIRLTLPASATGDQLLEVRIAGVKNSKTTPIHIEDLAADVNRLNARLSALATAEYALALYSRADRGDVSPLRIDFHQQFLDAESIISAVASGKDPFAGRKGDFHKAYRSPVDDQLQPYRVFVPDQYDAASSLPLVIALHGMGGDENSMFDSYGGAMKREASRVGFLVACPKGRDTASMYLGAAETDVLDVLAEVRRDYRVDPARIYIMGHSMGGFGTWSLAMKHPQVWAALGPIAGGGNPEGMAGIKRIPQYVVHGDNDKTVPVRMSRVMVEAGKKAGGDILYVEIPGGSHVDVAAPQFGPMFDFFAKQKKAE